MEEDEYRKYEGVPSMICVIITAAIIAGVCFFMLS